MKILMDGEQLEHSQSEELMLLKTDMLMLVTEIEVGDKTADDVDKLVCSADVVKSRQFDYLEEISGELMPSIIVNEERIKREHEEIRLVENLLYDNSSPRPSKELNAEIAYTIVESLSPSPIPVEDSDSLMDEIDLFFATDDLIPPGIESDDYDSEGDLHFL
uniref:Reverse transcriptase domain-containing protein n=1 Tax=Tanacetum cinerariifolium TaxID=118510 RepID=A0A6L2KC86_TANCI|nr:hypothetical protein [Tanacetum cinerariifolium]